MKKVKKINSILLIILVVLSFTILFSVKNEVLAKSYSEQYDNICEQDDAYYRIDETLEDMELFYGVNYRHDSAFSLIKNSAYIIGMACGGATYGNVALTVNTEYSQSAHILTIPTNSGVKIVPWAIINNGNWQLSTILQVAQDYEAKHPGYKVIAGINGDFFDISANGAYPRTVSGSMVCDGEVFKAHTSSDWPSIAFRNDGTENSLIKIDHPTYDSEQTLYVYDKDDNIIYQTKVNSVNGDLVNIPDGETKLIFANYTNTDTEKHIVNKKEVTDAFIVSDPDKTVAYSTSSFYGIGKINSFGSSTIGANQFAIKTANVDLLKYLEVGVKIRVQNELIDMAGEQYVCGICSTFLEDGKHVVRTHYDYMQYRYPRTLIGKRADGTVVMAVTDGRQSEKGYYGLNGVESACQMALEGCTEAYSFDGGGSTTMCIMKNGELVCVNSPSDGGLRSDGNAVLIVAPIPEINSEIKTTTSSVSFTCDIVKMIENYNELYIECDGKKKKLEEGKEIIFDSLESNSTYNYQFYAYLGGAYYAIPIGGNVRTSKLKYTIDDVSFTTSLDKNGEKVYEMAIEITDREDCIVTAVLLVNGKRISLKDGKYIVPASYGNPLTCGVLSITYETDLYVGRVNDQIKDYPITISDNEATSFFIDAISDIINSKIDTILSGK